MQIRITIKFVLLLVVMAVSSLATVSNAQQRDASHQRPHAELALDYDYIRSNAPPGGCGCFNLNGANASFAFPLGPHHVALVGDLSVTHAGAIASNGYSLTLGTYTVGGRFSPPLHDSRFNPFGQVLIGVAHSSGSLVQASNGSSSGGASAFASLVGGGIDLRASRRFSLRLIDADYLVTTFKNGGNDHQNMLRLGAGLVFQFKRFSD